MQITQCLVYTLKYGKKIHYEDIMACKYHTSSVSQCQTYQLILTTDSHYRILTIDSHYSQPHGPTSVAAGDSKRVISVLTVQQ